MKSSVFPLLLLGVAVPAVAASRSGYTQASPKLLSALWGEDGESWEPEKGSPRAFTNVGYLEGVVPIPRLTGGVKMIRNAKDRWVGISSREVDNARILQLEKQLPQSFS